MTNQLIVVGCTMMIAGGIRARTFETPALGVSRNLTMMNWEDLLRNGTEVQESWEEIPSIKKMEGDVILIGPTELAILNTLALAPGAMEIPAIEPCCLGRGGGSHSRAQRRVGDQKTILRQERLSFHGMRVKR